MVSGSGHDCSVSRHLSHALEEIGFNEATVRRIKWSNLQLEKLLTTDSQRNGNFLTYIFGSQSEGTTTPGLHADIDILLYDNDLNVIQDLVEWRQGKNNLLMLLEDTLPGYCRLQMLRSDVPLPEEDLSTKGCICDQQKRVLLMNTSEWPWFHEYEVNGPAVTFFASHNVKVELIYALRCSSWPPSVCQWTKQAKRGNWSLKSLVQQAGNDEIYLVPVGHKLSPTPELEWRISFSKTERRLMFSMNIIQLKCYVVLKMLMKSFVVPKIGDSITSYHCKTAMFHAIEDTSGDWWREENLIECIVHCLRLLLTWVVDMFCPHFIIPDANLFAGKITAQNQHKVHGIVKDLEDKIVQYICRIAVDELGSTLQGRLSGLAVLKCPLDLQKTTKVICGVHCRFHMFWLIYARKWLLEKKSLDTEALIGHIKKELKTQRSCLARTRKSDTYDIRTTQRLCYLFSFWLGSLLAAAAISCNRKLTHEARNLLKKGDKTDIASLLKLASIFYCSEESLKAQTVLNRVDERYRKHEIWSLCCCINKNLYSLGFAKQVYETVNDTERASLFTGCVKFSPQERHCAPPALRHEFERAIGDDMAHRDPDKDDWMDLAAVDSLPLLRFLQYLTYGKTGKRDRQKVALQQLEQCLTDHNNYMHSHLETGWNLLGQCMEQEKQSESAMRCYRTSLAIRPRNNAANWLATILCYKFYQLKDGL